MSFQYFHSVEEIDQFIDLLSNLNVTTANKLHPLKETLQQMHNSSELHEQQLKKTHALLSNLSTHAHNTKLKYQEFHENYPELDAAKLKIIGVEEAIKDCALQAKHLANYQILALFTALILIVTSFSVFIGLTIGLGPTIPSLPLIALFVLIPTLISIIIGTHFCLKQINQKFDACFEQAVALDKQVNSEIKALKQIIHNLEQNPQIVSDYDKAIENMDGQISSILTQLDDFTEENPVTQAQLLEKHGIFQNQPSPQQLTTSLCPTACI